ncbi:MAG: class I SAM-dependent methyltransferase [candidate division Zixibacteria bacterium]|nr:class I SAM-dependent methyltransferase [candidate division Zixibacteria bacterium]
MENERDRMDQVFQARRALASRYRLDNPGNRFNFETLCENMGCRLHELWPVPAGKKILDIGAGELYWGDQFVAMGVNKDDYVGVDLLVWRLQKGRASGHDHQAVAASAAELPFESATFDLISQFTMMTSVLDNALKSRIAAEMIRVLKPGGYILWYDFRYSNPSNPDTCGIGRGELKRLFPEQPISLQAITLLPPLARKLGLPLLKFFHACPILRSHYLAWIGPKG